MALEGVTWELPRPFGELPWGLRGDCKHVRVLTGTHKFRTVVLLNSVPRVPFYDTVYATLNLAESRSFGAAGTFAFGTGTSDSVPPYRSPNFLLKKISFRTRVLQVEERKKKRSSRS